MSESDDAEFRAALKALANAGMSQHEIIEFVATEAMKFKCSPKDRPIRCKSLPTRRLLLIFDSSEKRANFIAQENNLVYLENSETFEDENYFYLEIAFKDMEV